MNNLSESDVTIIAFTMVFGYMIINSIYRTMRDILIKRRNDKRQILIGIQNYKNSGTFKRHLINLKV